MLANPGRRSDILFHLTDWGPTLYSAAGGDAAALVANTTLKLDGLDQWGAVSQIAGLNHTGPRSEVLLHLAGPDNNDASTWSAYSAYRIGSWKVVLAAPESPCTDGMNVSGGASCAHRATGWVSVNSTGRWYQKPAQNQICDPGPCLFNLEDDPLERTNLAGSANPVAAAALQELLGRLDRFNATRIPNQKFDCDERACP